jgi:hypothetical protein
MRLDCSQDRSLGSKFDMPIPGTRIRQHLSKRQTSWIIPNTFSGSAAHVTSRAAPLLGSGPLVAFGGRKAHMRDKYYNTTHIQHLINIKKSTNVESKVRHPSIIVV